MRGSGLDRDTLYAALVARDAAYEGRAFVGVTSTGVFCRLTCPARKPKKENCRFFATVTACLEAGFRPCKRCCPTTPEANADPIVRRLMRALEREPERRWNEADLRALGFDPSTVRRCFKRHYGMTFLAMARLGRLRGSFEALRTNGRVIDAQLEAQFESASGFREAFARLLGRPPGRLASKSALKADWISTPLGPMIAVSDIDALHLLEFIDRKALPTELNKLQAATQTPLGIGRFSPTDQIESELNAFFAGRCATFDTPMRFHGSRFTQDVWAALCQIPVGTTRSYGDVARLLGRPTAVRAVARANGANQLAIAVPCHRVIGSNGSLTGHGGGLWRKQRLIEIEQDLANNLRTRRAE